jgi:hypothetical protein
MSIALSIRKRTSILAALGLAALLASPTIAQSTPRPKDRSQRPSPTGALIDLRPRFTVGQEVRLNMDIATKRSGTAPTPSPDPDGLDLKGDGDGDLSVGMTLSLRCTAADPQEGYTLSMKIDTFRISGTMNGEPMNWDSKKQGQDEALDAALGGITGVTIPVTMDKNGNISEVGGGLAGIGGAMGGKLGGGDLFKSLFGPLTSRSSNTGEARVGDKWSNDDTMQAGLGTVKVRTDNTLKSANSSMAVIATKGTFSLDPQTSQQGIRLREGKLEGETKWNTADHMIESMNMKQKVVLEKRDPKGPTQTSTQTMDVKVSRVRSGR